MSKKPSIESLIIATKKSHPELSYAKIAKKLGCSVSWVQKTMSAEKKRKEELALNKRRAKLKKEVEQDLQELDESLEELLQQNPMSPDFEEDRSTGAYRMNVALYVVTVIIIFLAALVWTI